VISKERSINRHGQSKIIVKIPMKNLVAVTLFTAFVVGGTPGARAAEASNDKSAQDSKAEHKAKQVPFHGKVSAIDKTAKTIALEGKEKNRTFQITSSTKITKDGKPAIFDDVTAGESVGGRAKESQAGKWEVVTLNIGTKADKAKRDEKHGEKK